VLFGGCLFASCEACRTLSSALHPLPNAHPESLDDLVITRIRSSLVQHTDRFAVQSHPRSPESDICDVCLVFLALRVVRLDEEGYASRAVEKGAVKG
jgi:hypothetical protein